MRLTIVDCFRVTEELVENRLAYLHDGGNIAFPLGTWYVLAGWTQCGIPVIGSRVSVVAPCGDRLQCLLAGLEIRHGIAVVQLEGTDYSPLPRFSVLEFDTTGC